MAHLTRMVNVAGVDATGWVFNGFWKGIFLPLLPLATAWPDENRTWKATRRAEPAAGPAARWAKLAASLENMAAIGWGLGMLVR